MTVMQKKDGKMEFVIINLREVDYIDRESKYIVFHMDGEKYYHFSAMTEFEDLLEKAGFDALDRSNLVNMGKIKSYDKAYGKVYFEDPPKSDSDYATVAKVKEKAVEPFIRFIINENKGVCNEVHPPQPKRLGEWFKSFVKGESK